MKKTFKTISAENLASFDMQCNELSAKAWQPVFPMNILVVYEDGKHFYVYTQQWGSPMG